MIQVLGKLPDDQLTKLFEELMIDPKTAPILSKVIERTNVGLKTDFVVERDKELKAEKEKYDEEQTRKWEEVDRERAITSAKTAEVVEKARQEKEKFEIEQDRKREEVERVRKITSENTERVIKEAKEKMEAEKREKRKVILSVKSVSVPPIQQSKEPTTLEGFLEQAERS